MWQRTLRSTWPCKCLPHHLVGHIARILDGFAEADDGIANSQIRRAGDTMEGMSRIIAKRRAVCVKPLRLHHEQQRPAHRHAGTLAFANTVAGIADTKIRRADDTLVVMSGIIARRLAVFVKPLRPHHNQQPPRPYHQQVHRRAGTLATDAQTVAGIADTRIRRADATMVAMSGIIARALVVCVKALRQAHRFAGILETTAHAASISAGINQLEGDDSEVM